MNTILPLEKQTGIHCAAVDSPENLLTLRDSLNSNSTHNNGAASNLKNLVIFPKIKPDFFKFDAAPLLDVDVKYK